MKLRYLRHRKDDSPDVVIMCKGDHRIELVIKQRDPHTFILIALSGLADQLPDKSKVQGPYHSLAQTQAARSAIANSLMSSGYSEVSGPAAWAIRAQREVREVRASVSKESGRYDFSPDDVFFNTLKPEN